MKEILSINYEEKIVTQFSLFLKNKIILGTYFCNMKKHDLKKMWADQRPKGKGSEVKVCTLMEFLNLKSLLFMWP